MIKLMYITNNVYVAIAAQEAGVDRIFIDLEFIGKELRQSGLDTVKSKHTISDIIEIKKHLSTSELLVRCNPIHDENEGYFSTEKEIDAIVKAGADIIMLPYFKTANEVQRFIKAVGGRKRTMLLFETPESIKNIDSILQVSGIDECYIGLNDLSLGYKMKFMFQPLYEGIVDDTIKKFKKYDKPFGFGGIASIGFGLLPSEFVLGEHVRLGSSSVILSRSFCNTNNFNKDNFDKIKEIFITGVQNIRTCEQGWKNKSTFELEKNKIQTQKIISQIVDKI